MKDTSKFLREKCGVETLNELCRRISGCLSKLPRNSVIVVKTDKKATYRTESLEEDMTTGPEIVAGLLYIGPSPNSPHTFDLLECSDGIHAPRREWHFDCDTNYIDIELILNSNLEPIYRMGQTK